ncbi:MAG: PAS domain S-box protein, partial [Gammaproteobacteria bacterium]|nr:PAS domain S-box protein [Gammaproteobacteria bacterium]
MDSIFSDAILNTSSDSVAVLDVDFRILKANSVFQQHYGFLPGQQLGNSVLSAEIKNCLQLAAQTLEPQYFENVHFNRHDKSSDARNSIAGVIVPFSSSNKSGERFNLLLINKSISDSAREEKNLQDGLPLLSKYSLLEEFFGLGLVGMVITSPNKKWIDVNQKFCDMVGYSREELAHLTWQDITHPDDVPENEKLANQAVEGELRGYIFEKRYIRKNGSVFFATVAANYIKRKSGEIDHIVGIVLDRTDEIFAEKQRDRFFDLSVDMLCIANSEGYFTALNPSWSKVLGYSKEELTSRPFLEFVHLDDRVSTEQEAARLFVEDGATINFVNRYTAKDGGIHWLSWNATRPPELDEIYAVAHDITDLKKAEEELLRHREDLSDLIEHRTQKISYQAQIIEQTSESIISVDINELVTTWNSGAVRLFGFDAKEMMGKHLSCLFSNIDYSKLHKQFKQLNKPGDSYETEIVVKAKNGKAFFTHLSISTLWSEDLQILGLAFFFLDISDRKKMESALISSESETRAILHALPDLMFQIS